MNRQLARAANTSLFLAAWILAAGVLAWTSGHFLLETRHFTPGQVPRDFLLVVEEAPAAGMPHSYRWMPWQALVDRPLAAGESLRLSAPAHEFPGTCCFGFRVVEDGPGGQVIEFNADDMAYLRSVYRVHGERVTPLLHRKDYSLYWLGYLLAGALVAALGTARLRRCILATAH